MCNKKNFNANCTIALNIFDCNLFTFFCLLKSYLTVSDVVVINVLVVLIFYKVSLCNLSHFISNDNDNDDNYDDDDDDDM